MCTALKMVWTISHGSVAFHPEVQLLTWNTGARPVLSEKRGREKEISSYLMKWLSFSLLKLSSAVNRRRANIGPCWIRSHLLSFISPTPVLRLRLNMVWTDWDISCLPRVMSHKEQLWSPSWYSTRRIKEPVRVAICFRYVTYFSSVMMCGLLDSSLNSDWPKRKQRVPQDPGSWHSTQN